MIYVEGGRFKFCEGARSMIDYSPLDNPSTLMFIFFPRKDSTACPENAFDVSVPVGEDISIPCRFYQGHPQWPWILFFHGNGEVVSDYDEIAPFYHRKKLNLVVADYRGYGSSGGVPTLTDLVRDAHALFEKTEEELSRRSLRSSLWVMGRSLGSISALELAYHHPHQLRGLIIESGFPSVVRIIEHLRIPTQGADLRTIDQACLNMIERISIPSLIIHGEMDTLVPLREAEDIYRHLGADQKELLVIPLATHNDISYVGFQKYFEALQTFVGKTSQGKSN